MFQWLKEWFNPKSSYLDNLPPFSGSYPPMPECKPPKPNISEPVFAIERSMIEHPSRWKVSFKNGDISVSGFTSINYTAVDIKNNLKFYGDRTGYLGYGEFGTNTSYTYTTQIALSWATQDEKYYLLRAIRNMQDKKLERVERIKKVKKNKGRQRLMEIYK